MVEITTDENTTVDSSTDDDSTNVDAGVLAGHPRHSIAEVRDTYRD